MIEATEMWSRSSAKTSNPDGQKQTSSFVSAYQITHEPTDSRAAILAATGVPQEGDVFSENGTTYGGVFCVDRSLDRQGPAYSVLTANWLGESGLTEDPLNKPPEITRGNDITSEETDSDFYGQPLTNSIGEPVQGVNTDVSDFTTTIVRNFASVNMYAIRAYLRSHNSDEFDGWPPGTARFRTYTSNERRFQDRIYYEVTATIKFREPYNTTADQAWYARYRNEGFYERSGLLVSFSGGGGSGAAGYAVANASGGVSRVVVTDRGRGYTSAPTVTFTKNPTSSPGSGATATANVNSSGVVSSVTVNAAGSAYRAQFVRAVDDEGEPVTSPVLLAIDGSRLTSSDDAVWLTRPLSGPLPYANLGLLD